MIINSAIRRDIGWMYVIFASNFILPLLLIPYLTRVLGASGWGYLAFWLTVSIAITMVVEYGFNISGQRAASRLCNDKEALSVLFTEVVSAKIFLIIPVSFLFATCIFLLPQITEQSNKLFGVLYCGVAQALSVTWYLRGTNQIKFATCIEVASKLIGVLLVLISVSEVTDAWKYFYAFGVGHTVMLIVAVWSISLSISLRAPSIASAFKGLNSGINVFILHATGTFFTISSVFFLGFQTTTKEIGYFSGADKIIRFLSSLIEPIRQALFPKINQMICSEKGPAITLLKKICLIFCILSTILGVVVYATAPYLVVFILGSDFLPSVPYLRIMSILLPILAINATLGYLWMLPNGLDRVCMITMVLALFINILLGAILVPNWGILGMTIAIIISELFVISIFIYYFRKGMK